MLGEGEITISYAILLMPNDTALKILLFCYNMYIKNCNNNIGREMS